MSALGRSFRHRHRQVAAEKRLMIVSLADIQRAESPPQTKPRRVSGVLCTERVGCYFVLFVVYQICGAPLTPDFSIALFNSGDAANALACSRLWKS